MTGFQIAVARETLSLAQRVLAGEHFTPAERRAIARLIWHVLRYQAKDEPMTPEIRTLENAYLDLKGIERSMAAGGGRWEMNPSTAKEPQPIHNDSASIWQLVISDMLARESFGVAKYNTVLQISDGRDHLIDAYQEALDLAVYLRQEIEQRKHDGALGGPKK